MLEDGCAEKRRGCRGGRHRRYRAPRQDRFTLPPPCLFAEDPAAAREWALTCTRALGIPPEIVEAILNAPPEALAAAFERDEPIDSMQYLSRLFNLFSQFEELLGWVALAREDPGFVAEVRSCRGLDIESETWLCDRGRRRAVDAGRAAFPNWLAGISADGEARVALLLSLSGLRKLEAELRLAAAPHPLGDTWCLVDHAFHARRLRADPRHEDPARRTLRMIARGG